MLETKNYALFNNISILLQLKAVVSWITPKYNKFISDPFPVFSLEFKERTHREVGNFRTAEEGALRCMMKGAASVREVGIFRTAEEGAHHCMMKGAASVSRGSRDLQGALQSRVDVEIRN